MSAAFHVFGVDCKLGYGFNDKIHHFYKFDAEPEKIKICRWRLSGYSSFIFVSPALLPVFVSPPLMDNFKNVPFQPLGEYLIEGPLKILDFVLESRIENFPDQESFLVFMHVVTRTERASKFKQLDQRTGVHVSELQYGIQVQILLPSSHFLEYINERVHVFSEHQIREMRMNKLMKAALENVNKLSQYQKQLQCRVLINTSDTRQMTLEQVCTFLKEYGTGPEKSVDDPHVVLVTVEKNRQLVPSAVQDDPKLASFLTYLYACYRKIELQMDSAGCPEFFEVPEQKASTVSAVRELLKAKESFRQMDTTDWLKMYPVLKTLFYRYRVYLRFCADHLLAIDEGADLPATDELLKSWLARINGWRPSKAGNRWFGSTDKLLISPPGFDGIRAKMTALVVDLKIDEDAGYPEPLLFIHRDAVEGVFGFVSLTETIDGIDCHQENANLLSIKCPQKCSGDDRKWICNECGHFIKCFQIYLMCSCGCALFQEKNFICNHPNHLSQLVNLYKSMSTETNNQAANNKLFIAAIQSNNR